MCKITLPMVKPAILSTILLVFGSSMGSYPVPHYLGLTTLSTKYVSMNSKYTGEASILAIIMMIFGVAIMLLNQMSLHAGKNLHHRHRQVGTDLQDQSGPGGQIHHRPGPGGGHLLHQYLPHRLLRLRDLPPQSGGTTPSYTPGTRSNLTTKWWVTDENITENGMYGQKGILHNDTIWNAFKGTLLVSVACALLAAPSAPSSATPCPRTGEVRRPAM